MSQAPVDVIILGLGKVGREAARQLSALNQASGFTKFAVIALADSQACLTNPGGFNPKELSEVLAHKEKGQGLDKLPGACPLSSASCLTNKRSITVDTSASLDTLPFLEQSLNTGGNLVLANKLPLAQPWNQASIYFNNPRVRYESTVGAGLPVIASLKALVESGDSITLIEGCMSGTLTFLFSQLSKGLPYSQAVRAAFDAGFTEPDPRQDLGGLDVARKALILARTYGFSFEMPDIRLEGLYPANLDGIKVPEFLSRLESCDADFAGRVKAARANSQVLRYMARVTAQKLTVGVQPVPAESAAGILAGSDNYFAISTRRYDRSPMVISGPGAGVAVTAAGVVIDILRLSEII